MEVRRNPSPRSHTVWDIIDPATGTILTGISRTQGDPNWHYNIRRILRRAGFELDFGANKKRKNTTGEAMPAAANKEAVDATVARLGRFFSERGPELEEWARVRAEHAGSRGKVPKGKGARSEFVRIAMYGVAPTLDLWAWKSESSGQQTLHQLLEKGGGAGERTLTLLGATMDYIENLSNEDWLEKFIPVEDTPPVEETPPQELPHVDPETGADTTTYDIAIQLIEEYEDGLRKIGQIVGIKGIEPEKILVGVKALRAARDELQAKYDETYKDLREMNKKTLDLSGDGVLEIRANYAQTLLAILAHKENWRGETNSTALDMILTRLDTLAAI